MSQPKHTGLLTVESLYELPDDDDRYELVAGVLLCEPPPGVRHGRVVARITALLDRYARSTKAGVVFTGDCGYVLARSPDTLRAPDVSFVTRERFDAVGDITSVFPGCPDLAVEVLSPSNSPSDVRAKVADYLAAGTRAVWVVEPVPCGVTVYRALLSPRALDEGEILKDEDLLPGFEAPIAELFEI